LELGILGVTNIGEVGWSHNRPPVTLLNLSRRLLVLISFRFSEPSGLKSKFSRKGILGNLQGDNGERKFQEKFAALNIGGILIANVSKKEIADFKAKMNRQDPIQQKFSQKQGNHGKIKLWLN
jgi:hypothetical protein